jgi:serine/threonine protein kinase
MAMMRLRREDPRVVGSFRLHRRLGAGGMGVVYLGSDRRGQRVALKVIRPDLAEDKEFRSRFAREVSAARRIRGGCTARLVAADLDADRPWFATQYVPGPSLHDKVQDSGPLTASHVASVGAALAEGLVAVHEAGVVHRDLKPSNILLSPKGPRIIDFGIAWATGASTLTHVGTAVGSPGFLAPEQVRGALVTPATDVFALGATLAYAATADSPFGQGSSEVMLYRVVHEEPLLDDVHAALAPLLHACLVKSPEDRPSPLQLSLRLKEIAAREARGVADHGGASAHGPDSGLPVRSAGADTEADRPGPPGSSGRTRDGAGPRSRPGGARVRRPSERVRPRTETSRRERHRTQPRGTSPGTSGHSGSPRPGGPRTGERPSGAGRSTTRTHTRPGVNTPAGRGGSVRRPSGGGREPGPGAARRSAARRLLRQRLVVFVTVTLLVALGIAAAQGCQGPTRGLGGERPAPTAPAPHGPYETDGGR